VAGYQRKPACRGRTLRPPGYLGFRPRRTRAGRCRASGNLMFPCCYNPSNATSPEMEGRREHSARRTRCGQLLGCAPLRNLPVLRLLPHYRFRFMIVPRGSFFSILPVFTVMPQRPVTRGQTQLVADCEKNVPDRTVPLSAETAQAVPKMPTKHGLRTRDVRGGSAQAVPKMPTKHGSPAKQGKIAVSMTTRHTVNRLCRFGNTCLAPHERQGGLCKGAPH